MIYIGNNKLVDVVVGNKVIKEIYDGNKLLYKKNNDWPGLKFTSKNDNSYVSYQINGKISCDIYYSRDGINWTWWEDGSTIYLSYNEFIYVWNKSNTLNIDSFNYLHFITYESIEASGNINSMINFSEILYPYCYHNMFMFDCYSLVTAPELPSTNLADHCYDSMFNSCGSLTTAPELPATNLAIGCYESMFNGCGSLTTAPELPATNLAIGCYESMFSDCPNLQQIKLHYTGDFDDSKFNNWVFGINVTGTLYYNGIDTTRGYSAIPSNFIVLTF